MNMLARIRRFWFGPGPADPLTEEERKDVQITPTDERAHLWEDFLDEPAGADDERRAAD
jgi:hypothetical protein